MFNSAKETAVAGNASPISRTQRGDPEYAAVGHIQQGA